MSDSNWSVRVAVIGAIAALTFVAFGDGFYLAALNYPKQERYQPYRHAAGQPQEVDPTAPRPSDPETFKYREPCREPEGTGESDLCAQWKAARAAERSALWTARGFWIALIGSSLLLWQIILTRRAVEDTGEATEAMREANKIAREAQRPWLSAKAHLSSPFTPGRTHEWVDGFYVSVAGEIKNHGDSPATDIHVIVDIRLPSAGVEPVDLMHTYCDQWREKAFTGGPARFAGQTMPFEHLAFIPQSDIDRALAECGEFKMIAPILVGCVSYRTLKVPGVRQTRFMYRLAAIEDGKAKVIRADSPNWWEGTIQVMDHETVAAD